MCAALLVLVVLSGALAACAAEPVAPVVLTDALKAQIKAAPVGDVLVLPETVGCQQCLRRYEKVSATEWRGLDFTGQCTPLPCAKDAPVLKVAP